MATPNSSQHREPMVHGGRPDGGRHVPSSVPGHGPYDASSAVGSNVTCGPMPDQDSAEVLESPPWIAANPNAAQWMPPIN